MEMLIILIPILYYFLIRKVVKTWNLMESGNSEQTDQKVSIVIVGRNEEGNIPRLLQSLEDLTYPRVDFEVVYIDDHSDDNSLIILEDYSLSTELNFQYKALDVGEGKKSGLTYGVSLAAYSLVVTTDADCEVPPNWLSGMVSGSVKKFVSGPVRYADQHQVWKQLVELDFISLIVLGGVMHESGKPILANGANMMFHKSDFIELGGFGGNEDIASGDDVFLLKKMHKRYPQKTAFVKDKGAIVSTKMADTLSEFLQQRIRWAKKMKSAGMLNSFLILLSLVYACFFMLPLGLFFIGSWNFVALLAAVFLIKVLIDLYFFRHVLSFFGRKVLINRVWFVSLLHPFYFVFMGLISVVLPFHWKNRKYHHG